MADSRSKAASSHSTQQISPAVRDQDAFLLLQADSTCYDNTESGTLEDVLLLKFTLRYPFISVPGIFYLH